MNKNPSVRFAILALAILSFGFAPNSRGEGYWERQLRLYGKINLPVKALLQLKLTSCGEASIAMAYNYANPEERITEQVVIDYAVDKGYYTESESPFTSPEDMVRIGKYFSENVSSGRVKSADEGLSLLKEKLTGGDPLIIDIFSRLDDPQSGAHLVVVTGLKIDSKNPNKTKIYFNDPLTGTNRWGYWLGGEGVWNAWQNNGDPGGAGWWMMIQSP